HPSSISSPIAWGVLALISTGKAENAMEVSLTLHDMKNKPIPSHPMYFCQREAGCKVGGRHSCPLNCGCQGGSARPCPVLDW
ncbi:hypothetical protein PISMIDRAFT_101104, partial [Pisolithus microcarpus 441]